MGRRWGEGEKTTRKLREEEKIGRKLGEGEKIARPPLYVHRPTNAHARNRKYTSPSCTTENSDFSPRYRVEKVYRMLLVVMTSMRTIKYEVYELF